MQGHGYRRPRLGAERIRGGQCGGRPVLQVIDVYLSLTFVGHPLDARVVELRVRFCGHPFGEKLRLVVAILRTEGDVDMQPGRTGSFAVRGNAGVFKDGVNDLGDFDYLFERSEERRVGKESRSRCSSYNVIRERILRIKRKTEQ